MIGHRQDTYTKKHLLNGFDRACKQYHDFYSGEGVSVYAKRFFRYPIKFFLRFFATNRFLPQNIAVRSKTFWGKILFVLLADKNAGSLWYFGILPKQEIRLTRYLIKTIRPKDAFYDVGANYGFYSALAEALGAMVHAFEPHPLIAKCLRRSFPRGVIVNEVALSNTQGDVEFYDRYQTQHSGGSTLSKHIVARDPLGYHTIVVPSIRLDSYSEPSPKIIKIDVEGAELDVLRGGKRALERHGPDLILELWGGKNPEDQLRSLKVVRFLKNIKYRAYRIEERGNVSPISYADLEENLAVISYDNFLFRL